MSDEQRVPKWGDVREDGYRFTGYGGADKNGKRYETWLSPDAWERQKMAKRQYQIDHLDETVAHNKRKRHMAKKEKVLECAKWFALKNRTNTEIRRHLDRGRDVGDIAVRMRIPVSVVLAEKEQIAKELRMAGAIA